MHKLAVGLLGATALAVASAAQAAVITIDLGSQTGDLGPNATYTTVSNGNVVASGYSGPSTSEDVYGKNDGGNEVGLGLLNDPTQPSQHEIYSPGPPDGAFIQLDVSQLVGISSIDFFMNSATNGEEWAVYGSNTDGAGVGTWLMNGSNEGSSNTHNLVLGQYDFYNFYSLGTNGTTFGNVLLGGLTLNEAVPEPATWALMLLGFGAVGWQLRRRGRAALPQMA